MKKLLFFTAVIHLAITNLAALPNDGLLFGQSDTLHVVVNNRVLAKVNGKAISVMDLMKKMDIHFYRQFPQYTSSVPARFQFYQTNWKQVIQETIDKELLLADAEENKLPVSNGDIRQEMENMFGPNIIANLDKINLSFDEAWSIIKGDIIIRRMLFYRVNAKAMRQVTPQKIREVYDQFAKENPREEQWRYYVISIRDKDAERGAEAAKFTHQLLEDEAAPIDQLASKAKLEGHFDEGTLVNTSEELRHTEKEMSANYKSILSQLKSGQNSPPVVQKSRSDNSTVYRIFHLKEKIPAGVIALSEVEGRLKEKLLDEAISIETDAYLKKLRQHYHVQESQLKDMTDDDFQPFSMK